MKKILILVLSLISIIGLTSCHREVPPNPSPTPTDPLWFICLHKWNIKNRIEVSETEIEIEYVCYKCGEIKKEITKKPEFNIFVTGSKELLIDDLNGLYRENTLINFEVKKGEDYSIEVYFNGTLLNKEELDNTYKFSIYMPAYHSVIYIKQIFAPHTHEFELGLCKCGLLDEQWLNENFDINSEQHLNPKDEMVAFSCDLVIITFKPSKTWPILTVDHLGISNAFELEYGLDKPEDFMFEKGNEDKLASFKQTAYLFVVAQTREEILDIISELEKLPFIDSVLPNFILYCE